MVAALDTRPVGPSELSDLADLFGSERTTRHCWCMAFCSTRVQFAGGWFTGGNRRRFASLLDQSTTALGVLASQSGEPVGWCACGPRSRYVVGPDRPAALRHRPPSEDEDVWLVACLFVRPGHRGQGVADALVRAAVALAGREGAVGIEGWPLAAGAGRTADAFLGREELFGRHGFTRIEDPVPDRVIMRLELGREG